MLIFNILLFVFVNIMIFRLCAKQFDKIFLSLIFSSQLFLISFAYSNNKFYAFEKETMVLLILGLLSLIFGYILYCLKFSNKEKSRELAIKPSKNKIIIAILIVFTIVLIYYKLRYDNLIDEYGVSTARLIKFELGMLFRTPLENAAYRYVIEPGITLIIINLAFNIAMKKVKSVIVLLSFVSIFLYSSIGMGRFTYFDFAIYSMLVILLYYSQNIVLFIKENYKWISLTISLVTLILIFVTLERLGVDFTDFGSIKNGIEESMNHLLLYFTGPYGIFNYAIENDYRGVILSNYGGVIANSTIGGLDELVKLSLNFIGQDFITINSVLSSLTSVPVEIGANISMNAFYTAYFNFYVDFGIIGLLIIPFSFGFFSAFINHLVYKKQSIYILFIAIINNYCMLMMILKWEYQSAPTWMLFIWLLIFYCYIHLDLINKIKRRIRKC